MPDRINMPYVPDVIPAEDRDVFRQKYYAGKGEARIDFGKFPALIIVDMTNEFVLDEYPTGFSTTGVPCAQSIKKLEDACRRSEVPVIYTKGIFSSETGSAPAEEGRWLDKMGVALPAELKQKGNQIYHMIKPRNGEIVIPKAKPSAFFGTQLTSILTYLGVDTLIVTGMVTSGCVRATAVDAFSYNYRVIIPEECVADRSQISHEVNLFDMDMKYAEVLKLAQVLEHIEKIVVPRQKITA